MTEAKYQFRMPIAAHAVALMVTTGNLLEQLREGEVLVGSLRDRRCPGVGMGNLQPIHALVGEPQ